jgi:H+/Cl- antiporter ClcA/predicted transcriptional regulator
MDMHRRPKSTSRLVSFEPAPEWRRLVFLTGLTAAIGLIAGAAAFLLIRLIALISNIALFGRFGWELPPSSSIESSPRLVIAAVVGGFVVALIARWSPIIRGHGIPEAMEAVLVRESRIAPRTAIAKPVSAAVAIGSGGPFGAEGPIIVTGGAIGSLVGQVLSVSASERKILLAAGAAAGMAATFGSPLAAVVLAIELLLFEFSTRAIVPLLVSTSIAAGVHAAIFGAAPLFAVPTHEYYGLANVPAFAVLGVGCGLLATVIGKGLFAVEAGFRRLPVSSFWHPVIGGLGFGLVGLIVPGALGVGYDEIGDVLLGRMAVGAIATLLVGKLVAWWIALGSGTSGGTLAPVLLMSGCFGSLFASAVGAVAPGLHPSPPAYALVAMAATFAAATRTPLTSIVFIFELTRDYDAVLPLMGTTVIAVLVTRWIMSESLMTEKLARRGLRVHGDYEVDRTKTTHVGDVMTTDVVAFPAHASPAEATALIGDRLHSSYPVVDVNGRCIGVVSRHRLADSTQHPSSVTISDLAVHLDVVDRSGRAPTFVTTTPEETVHTLLSRLLDVGADHAAVIDPLGHLVGICTRTDILKPRAAQFELERRDPGWARGPTVDPQP